MPVDVQQWNPTKNSNVSCHFLPRHHPSSPSTRHQQEGDQGREKETKRTLQEIKTCGTSPVPLFAVFWCVFVFWAEISIAALYCSAACQQVATQTKTQTRRFKSVFSPHIVNVQPSPCQGSDEIVLIVSCMFKHLGMYAVRRLCSSNLFGRRIHTNTQAWIRYVDMLTIHIQWLNMAQQLFKNIISFEHSKYITTMHVHFKL